MESQAWIELALKTLGCNQKVLAQRVGVSQTQITKWKNGDHMSSDMERKFRKLLKVATDHYPEFILWAGSVKAAEKWDRLIHFLAEKANDQSDTGYETYPLQDDEGLLISNLVGALNEMGVKPPFQFPNVLDLDFDAEEDVSKELAESESQSLWEIVESNPYCRLIFAIFNAVNDVWGFYEAYVSNLGNDGDAEMLETKMNIETGLIELAACKIEVDEEFAPKIKVFRRRVLQDFEKWLGIMKLAAFQQRIPLKAELLDLVRKSSDELGNSAEEEAVGENDDRLHPDIYMNELLVGVRVINQALPLIMKKLGIEFKINDARLGMRPLRLDIPDSTAE